MVRRHVYLPAEARDDDCLDQRAARVLLRKVWCHGQLSLAFQLLACFWWAVAAESVPTATRWLALCLSLLLAPWGAASASIFRGRAHSLVLGLGGLLFLVESAVLLLAAAHADETLSLVLVCATFLGMVELLAFLLLVACMHTSVGRGGDGSDPRMLQALEPAGGGLAPSRSGEALLASQSASSEALAGEEENCAASQECVASV